MKKTTAELARDALETSKNGLLWYADAHPVDRNGSDDEAIAEIDAALDALEIDIAQSVTPGMKQLIAQLNDEQKWTVSEQQQFAEFLKRFPNESSQGIISLGDAWKYGKACASPQEPAAPAWIAVSERLPDDGSMVLVYTPPMDGDDERYDFEFYEDECWVAHNNNYEHFMVVGGANAAGPDCVCTGPSESAKYTHWMPRPTAPRSAV